MKKRRLVRGERSMRVYADNAATTRLNPKAKEAMFDYYSTVFGNPSSVHSIGIEAAEALRHARKNIADLMGCIFI